MASRRNIVSSFESQRFLKTKEAFRSLFKIKYMIPRPCCGHFGWDIFHIFLILFLQFSVLPDIFHHYLVIDIVTPWLLVSFVRQDVIRSAILLGLAALLLETQSTAPFGMYMSIYWFLAILIFVSRDFLAWRHISSWIVAIVMGVMTVAAYETLVVGLTGDILEIDLRYCLTQSTRVFFSVFIGVLFAYMANSGDFKAIVKGS